MKAFIVNDTTRIFKRGRPIVHFGCSLVMQTFREQLNRVGIELVGTSGRDEKIMIPKGVDLVIVNGEGSIHHGRHSRLVKVAKRYPAVLVNAVWQDNPSYPTLKAFKYIAVRESLSHNQLPKNCNAHVVPDILYASATLRYYAKPKPTKGLGKTDNVVDKKAGFTIHVSVNEYLNTLCQYERVCSGRFHAAVAASILNIPFNVWSSSTHKMQGLVRDMGVPHLFHKTQKEALLNVPTTVDERIEEYATKAQITIEKMFEHFHEVV